MTDEHNITLSNFDENSSNNYRKNINNNLYSYFEGEKFQEAVESVVKQVCKLLNAELAGVMLYDEQKQELILQKPAFGEKSDQKIGIYRVPINGEGVGITVFRSGTPLISNNPASDLRVLQHIVEAYPARNLVTIPLEYDSRRIGVLHVINKKQGDFIQEDLNLLSLVSNYVTLLLENAVHYEVEKKHTAELRKSYQELEKQQQRLQRLMGIHGKLVRSILHGEGLTAIIITLAELLNCLVIVEDKHFNIVCSAKNGVKLELHEFAAKELLESIKNNSTIEHYLKETASKKKLMMIPALPHEGIDYQRVLVPLADRYSILGYLSVLFNHKTLDEFDKIAIEQAALVASLELVKEKNDVEIETKLKGELIDDLINGTNYDKERIISRAGYFNYNLNKPQSVAVLRLEMKSEKKDDYSNFKSAKKQVFFLVNRILQQSIIVEKREEIIILTPETTSTKDYYQKLNQISHEVAEKYCFLKIIIGIGQFINEIPKIRDSYLQANRVLEVMEKFDLSEKVLSYDQLGLFNLLYSVQEPAILKRFAYERLAPLLSYDQKNNYFLISSLECYLKYFNIKEAAKELAIHERTMKYRLKKIEEIAKISLNNPETFVELNLAIKINKIMSQD